MKRVYLGIDVGNIFTKGVIIDDDGEIVISYYLDTNKSPLKAVDNLLKYLYNKINLKDYKLMNVGITGYARRLVAKYLNTNLIKNEVTAHSIGALSIYPDVRTIFEIGGTDAKFILLKNKKITYYVMNHFCSSNIGKYLSIYSDKLKIDINDYLCVSNISNKNAYVNLESMFYFEKEINNKILCDCKKEEILSKLCISIANNYLNYVVKNKKIKSPIVFLGGVSKNSGIVNAFEKIINKPIIVDDNSQLMAALGMAIIAKNSKIENSFINSKFSCTNNCKIK